MDKQLMMFEGRHEVMILTKEDVNFDFKGDFLIRTKDVANVLEYQGTSATQEVLKFAKENQVFLVKNSNMVNRHIRLHNTGETFVTNLALNRILGKSEKPKAAPFQDWLYEDMLPSVQKHGAYLTPQKVEEVLLNPDTIITLATQLKTERAEKEKERLARLEAEEKLKNQKPLVHFAQTCLTSHKNLLVREVAKLASKNGIMIGEKRLYDKLRQWGYICQTKNEPTQRAMDSGYFEVKMGAKQTPEKTITYNTPVVTPRGQVAIINRLKREDERGA